MLSGFELYSRWVPLLSDISIYTVPRSPRKIDKGSAWTINFSISSFRDHLIVKSIKFFVSFSILTARDFSIHNPVPNEVQAYEVCIT